MRITFIAAIIEAVYNNGGPQTGTRKLDRDDFFQFALTSAGAALRDMFYAEKNQGDFSGFLSEMVDIKPFEVIITRNGVKTVEAELLSLHRNFGILNIFPLDGLDCDVNYEEAFTSIDSGGQSLYTPSMLDELGLNAYNLRKGKPVLYCGDEVEYVAVEGIFLEEDQDLPLAIARAVIGDVLGTVLKVPGFPADMTNDGDPNVQLVNSKIAAAEAVS